jgi:hypothetical protein
LEYHLNMPLDMNDLARRGAQSRLAELTAELESIRRAFPNLAGSPARQRGRPSSQGSDGAFAEPSVRKNAGGRKPMSAAAKKAVAARMRAYWQARKADGTAVSMTAGDATPDQPAVRPRRTMSAEAKARISASQKKRWKAQKRAAKKP